MQVNKTEKRILLISYVWAGIW